MRLAGNLLGDPMQEVAIGAPVEVAFDDHQDEQFSLVHWRLEGSKR